MLRAMSGLRAVLVGGVLLLVAAGGAAGSALPLPLEDADLGRYWMSDAQHVRYRAVRTQARDPRGLVPLIVFLHGDGQDGNDNQAQPDGRGNGSFERVDAARARGIALDYVAPQTTAAYWPPRRVAAVVADALARWPIDPRRIYLTGLSDGETLCGMHSRPGPGALWPRCRCRAGPNWPALLRSGMCRNGYSMARATMTPTSSVAMAGRWWVRARWCARCARWVAGRATASIPKATL